MNQSEASKTAVEAVRDALISGPLAGQDPAVITVAAMTAVATIRDLGWRLSPGANDVIVWQLPDGSEIDRPVRLGPPPWPEQEAIR